MGQYVGRIRSKTRFPAARSRTTKALLAVAMLSPPRFRDVFRVFLGVFLPNSYYVGPGQLIRWSHLVSFAVLPLLSQIGDPFGWVVRARLTMVSTGRPNSGRPNRSAIGVVGIPVRLPIVVPGPSDPRSFTMSALPIVHT